ncbi:AAA family ATPase [Corynebacterium tapiri]
MPVVRALTRAPLEFQAPVTVITGDNGSGKSTLMEAIALALEFDAWGGPRHGFDLEGKRRRTGTESRLDRVLRVETEEPAIFGGFYLRSETQLSLMEVADSMIGRAGRLRMEQSERLAGRSHGEGVFDILGEYMRGRGVYLLDEPESGLSVVRQMALLAEIALAAQHGGQFIVATHSPVLPAIPGADIVEIGDHGIDHVDFDSVESVHATREFLADPHGVARYLVSGD